MTVPALFAEASGRTTVTFTVALASGRKVHLEAVADPMQRGLDAVADLARGDEAVIPLLTTKGLAAWRLACPRGPDLAALCYAWADAAGLGDHGFATLVTIVQHLDAAEADFQRFYNLDLSLWPARQISTRRVVTLMRALVYYPESLFWAEYRDRDPLTKEAWVLAEFASSEADLHHFLVPREVHRQREADAAAIERMRARGFSS